ncbi:ATP-binding protein [Corynebacterium oculi]|nr:DUF4143 domain-containing protein [Corynebacterium oculi]
MLDGLLPYAPAIAIEGAKAVGKTATALQRAHDVLRLTRSIDMERVQGNVEGEIDSLHTLLIDEWQLYPPIWDAVRHSVDEDRRGGRFLLTGSAGPTRNVRIHSGAGRILRMRLRPLSFFERGICPPTVSMNELVSGRREKIKGVANCGLSTYVEEIIQSGFPGMRDLPHEVRLAELDGYIERICDHDMTETGHTVRRPQALRKWMEAYAAASSTTAGYSEILDAATPGESNKPSKSAALEYRETLERIFILDPIPGWSPALAPLSRATQSPKHQMVDPAIAARLMKIDEEALLAYEGGTFTPKDGSLLGLLFESLVTLSVRVMIEPLRAHLYHLRTKGGRQEIDLIVELDNRKVLPIEVKMKEAVDDRDVRHLHWLEDRIGDRVADKVVVTTGRHAYRRQDGVAVVPLALLGP